MPGQQSNSLHHAQSIEIRGLDGRYVFAPIVFENLGVPSASARQLLSDLGRRLTDISGESRETSYLFQRLSVLVQRFNAVLLRDSLPDGDCTDYWTYLTFCSLFFEFLNLPLDHGYRR